jgi:hypothetical protein
MLAELHLKDVGPGKQFDVEFGKRLNLFTGDNGLGKTFLLDVAWWTLTGTWAGNAGFPRQGEKEPLIQSRFWDKTGDSSNLLESQYDWSQQNWVNKNQAMPDQLLPGLVIYARVDGRFSVWDPVRNDWEFTFLKKEREATVRFHRLKAYLFDADTLWKGLEDGDKILCNGIIRDWVNWQYHPDQNERSPFQVLTRILAQLSPLSLETLKPGKPIRVSISDVRDIPTIEFPYGTVPVTMVSAGVRRILGLAYLLTWIWYEHTQAADLIGQEPCRQLTLLLDEAESHLHPFWQRSLLPSVLEVASALDANIQTQVIATTHSPLVLASVEPYFDESLDRLFLFELKDREVALNQVPWIKQGDTVGWLTSEVFGLKQARSREAELAIESAEAFMRGEDMSAYPENLRTKDQIHAELQRLLPGHDPFWPRWIVKTEMKSAR